MKVEDIPNPSSAPNNRSEGYQSEQRPPQWWSHCNQLIVSTNTIFMLFPTSYCKEEIWIFNSIMQRTTNAEGKIVAKVDGV